MELSKQELNIIFNYINENDDIQDIFNLNIDITSFIDNIKYSGKKKIYKLFKNKNPLVVVIPHYRKDINYFKAITYLYFGDNVNTVDIKGIILTLKLKKIYPQLIEDINTILYSNKNTEKVINCIIQYDNVELFKFYNCINNDKYMTYTILVQSYANNIINYIINNYKEDFKNTLSNLYNDSMYSVNIISILLEHYNINDIVDCVDFISVLKYFVEIYDDDMVLKILNITGVEADIIINILLDVKNLEKYIFLPKSFKYIIKNIGLDYNTFKLIYKTIKNIDDTFIYNKKIIINMLIENYNNYLNIYLDDKTLKKINIRHSI